MVPETPCSENETQIPKGAFYVYETTQANLKAVLGKQFRQVDRILAEFVKRYGKLVRRKAYGPTSLYLDFFDNT